MKLQKNKKENSEIEEKTVKKSHWRRNIFLFALVLLVAGIGFLYSYAQKPAQGIIKNSSNEKVDIFQEQDVPEVFMGKHFTFLYDKKYVLKSHDVAAKDGEVILEQAYFSQVSSMSKKIAVTVRSLPTHNFEDAPDFKMRSIHPERYRKEEFNLGDIHGVSFVPADQGQFEKTFFVVHGDILVIFAMMIPATEDQDLNKEADAIVKSISWLK